MVKNQSDMLFTFPIIHSGNSFLSPTYYSKNYSLNILPSINKVVRTSTYKFRINFKLTALLEYMTALLEYLDLFNHFKAVFSSVSKRFLNHTAYTFATIIPKIHLIIPEYSIILSTTPVNLA